MLKRSIIIRKLDYILLRPPIHGMPPYASRCRSCFPDFESISLGSLTDALCILARYSSSSCMISSRNSFYGQIDFWVRSTFPSLPK
jgi:hypothetical protein